MNKAFWVRALLLLVAGITALSGPVGAQDRLAAQSQPIDRTVQLQGLSIHFRVFGTGERTIILESGSGLGAATWDELAPRIAERTGAAVITYDRAGMGESDLPGYPYDIHDEMARLHQGLVELGRADRLVLVGHSYGGFLISVYSALYPETIAGLVYVDANTPTGIDALGGAEVIAAPRLVANDVENPTKIQQANLRLSRALGDSLETVRHLAPICGVPLVALSAGTIEANTSAGIRGWYAGHEQLARATGGRHRFIEGATHMMPRSRPDAIVDAVDEVFSLSDQARPRVNATGGNCPTIDG